MKKEIRISYILHEDITSLSGSNRELIKRALRNTGNSYAPYSRFTVGAALKLKSGKIIDGANQENNAYPSGLCAERVAMFAAGANHPKDPFDTIAVAAADLKSAVNKPVAPCGSCRQVMSEYEKKFNCTFRVLLYGEKGPVLEFKQARDLLPLAFDRTF